MLIHDLPVVLTDPEGGCMTACGMMGREKRAADWKMCIILETRRRRNFRAPGRPQSRACAPV